MVNILSVAEKPSVAKELARIIGQGQYERKNGHSPYNHLFEIKNCRFRNQPAKMTMTSVSGHLMEDEFEANFKGWNNCLPVDLFTAPIEKTVKKENSGIEKTLKQEAKKNDILLLWLDCDLEGENIAYEVSYVCTKANRRLDVYRARFSAIIERDIHRALAQPERLNDNMVDAVEARREIDLRIGAAFTRFQTMRLQKKFENVGKAVISYGPCQFPTLGFVVERDLKIKAFVPENFWHITCEVEFPDPDRENKKLTCSLQWDRHRVYDHFTAVVLYETCVEDGSPAVVTQCNQRPTSRFKPVPMNTIEFQVRASRFLKMGSDKAMNIAESLYQRGILSYPRTETNFFKEGFELMPIIQEHRNHSLWGNFATEMAEGGKFMWPRPGGKDDQAHPPIHPTKCVELGDLQNEDERRVYDLITRHFLAACSTDAKGNLSTFKIEIPHGGEGFTTTGLMVLERNWLEVYSKYESWGGNKVPTLDVGDTLYPSRLMLAQGRTTPPEPISEAELISTMDNNGIGTDATIATHIATIQQREYAVKNAQNKFTATKLGLALVEGYNSMGYQLNRPELRAQIEADCQRIVRGEISKQTVIEQCLSTMKDCFLTCNREAGKLDAAMTKYFATLGQGNEENENYQMLDGNFSLCGNCQRKMELRVVGAADRGRNGRRNNNNNQNNNENRYLYCTRCSQAHVLPTRGELQPHEVSCAICKFQVLSVHNAGTNKTHTICPQCFSNTPPPPEGIEGIAEFRCFSCAKEGCPLALRLSRGSDADIAKCADSKCKDGKMRLKRNPKGFLLSCTNAACKSVWFFPKFVKSVTPAEGEFCQRCQQASSTQVCKMNFSFFLDKAPRGIEPECMLCVACDPLWARISIAPLQLATAPQRQQRGANTASAPPARTLSEPAVSPAPHSEYAAALAGVATGRGRKNNSSNTNSTRGNNGSTSSRGRSAPPSGNSGAGDGDNVMCGCGEPSKLLTVSKEGPNKGRKFHSCSKPRDSGCGFFQWADQPGSGSSSGQHQQPPMAQQRNGPPSGEVPPCPCGAPAVCLTTTKEGPNKGRQFFCCAKNRNDSSRCDFFQWAVG